MKKKGFTLIELLAVIVILAIIALIATPAVLNIIEDSRKGAAEASARNIVSAAKTYYMSETMNGRTVGTIDLSTNTLKYDGDQASKGTITFTDGKPAAKMYISGYCVEVAVDGKVTSEKTSEDECTIEVTPSEPTQKLDFPVADGQEVYFNPNTGLACSASEVEANYNTYGSNHLVEEWDSELEDYVEKPSITGLKEGCMKWYAFLDSEGSNTVNLLLAHRTRTGGGDTNLCYDATAGIIPDNSVLLSNVAADTAGWKQVVNGVETPLTGRLISGQEIHKILKSDTCSDNWVSDYQCTIDIDDTIYPWLLDYDSNESYYTSDYSVSRGEGCNAVFEWVVRPPGEGGGGLTTSYAGGSTLGIRPVITVSKAVFE